MTVIANYIGPKSNGDYWVNVRNANPTGMIGDGGVIRRFKSEDEAKKYAETVNKTGEDTFEFNKEKEEVKPVRHEGDVFVPSSKAN